MDAPERSLVMRLLDEIKQTGRLSSGSLQELNAHRASLTSEELQRLLTALQPRNSHAAAPAPRHEAGIVERRPDQ